LPADALNRTLSEDEAIADLLDAMRSHALLRSSNRTLLRALISCANHQTSGHHRQIFQSIRDAEAKPLLLDGVLALKDSQTGGTLPEVTDGLGDSFVHPLREAMDHSKPALPDVSKKDWINSLQLCY
jgi:hypothetical protein